MDLYTSTSYQLARKLTERFSTSFSLSSRLFDVSIRHHIYAIYGLVRVADEIVDTYRGSDAEQQLDDLKKDTYRALATGFSANPIVHAFSATAKQFTIDKQLIEPFFQSMLMDCQSHTYTPAMYKKYIHGSAEVVGLMCLKVFVWGDAAAYERQHEAASALGSAYQKVNFLRDIADDYKLLGRVYFPGVEYHNFDEATKCEIVADIEHDFTVAKQGIDTLPPNARAAVRASYEYYTDVLQRIKRTPAQTLMQRRVRVPTAKKLYLLARIRLSS